jgi:hypothetical protein
MKDIYIHDFTDEEHESIRQAAQADQRSINSWCKHILLKEITQLKFDKEVTRIQSVKPGFVLAEVHSDIDLIEQKRDGKGRFRKK